MIIKYFKILFLLLLFYQDSLYSKNTDFNGFKSKDLSSYFSAIISYDNQKNEDALKFFKSSKSLINKHDPYLKQYFFSLILEGKIKTAIHEAKIYLNNKNSDFFELYLLLTLDSIKKNDFQKSKKYLNEISRFKEKGTFELIIYESLKEYIYLFENKKILINSNNFGNFSVISKTFQSCYINEKNTQTYFINLINNPEIDYSRYIFFYINYLLEQNKFYEAKKEVNQIDVLSSSLLIAQTKKWMEEKKIEKFSSIFSCRNEMDILGEFFFLIANLHSSQYDYEKSNFYLSISHFLNPKFKFNLSLLVENYYIDENYKKTKKILDNFNKNDDLYYWYKVKKESKIILKELNKEESFNFINSKFKIIKTPSIKILFDMANITKGFNKYEISINYFNEVLSKININSQSYSDILFRRGGSHERLSEFDKSDKDLLKSLEMNPDDPYVLNYLAYSWLERDYKIDTAIEMLEKAYNVKKNDPYILDSVGWAYYLVDDLDNAEKFLKKAIKLMPQDPIVNDHYGDILWKMNRKIQAKYYWESVLNSKDTEEKMKDSVKFKLLKGLKKI